MECSIPVAGELFGRKNVRRSRADDHNSLNPARSFGPCVVTGIFDKEHWIYCKPAEHCKVPTSANVTTGLGPAIGAIVAVLFYRFIKILEYEVTNPGQDEASEEDAAEAANTPKKETV